MAAYRPLPHIIGVKVQHASTPTQQPRCGRQWSHLIKQLLLFLTLTRGRRITVICQSVCLFVIPAVVLFEEQAFKYCNRGGYSSQLLQVTFKNRK